MNIITLIAYITVISSVIFLLVTPSRRSKLSNKSKYSKLDTASLRPETRDDMSLEDQNQFYKDHEKAEERGYKLASQFSMRY